MRNTTLYNEANIIILLIKPDKDITEKLKPISLIIIDAKILNQMLTNNPLAYKKELYNMTKWNIPRMKG